MRTFGCVALVPLALATLGCASTTAEEISRYLDRRMEEADRLREKGDLAGAIEIREQMLAEYPDNKLVNNPVFHTRLGNLYRRRGDDERALEHFYKALRLWDAYYEECRSKIVSSIVPKEIEEAKALIDDTIRPGMSETRRELAMLWAAEERYDMALQHLERGIDVCPSDLRALRMIAEYRESAGDADAAADAWRKFIRAVLTSAQHDRHRYKVTDADIVFARKRVEALESGAGKDK